MDSRLAMETMLNLKSLKKLSKELKTRTAVRLKISEGWFLSINEHASVLNEINWKVTFHFPKKINTFLPSHQQYTNGNILIEKTLEITSLLDDSAILYLESLK